MNQIDHTTQETLVKILPHMLGEPITGVTFEATPLHGGTLGEVRLLTGMAELSNGTARTFQLVRKTQKKWARNFDADSWRREYDLYASQLGTFFHDALRWPKCYHQELTEDAVEIWMEYIAGISGLALTGEMLEQAAAELGRFQGRLFREKPELLSSLSNLSQADFAKKNYLHYRSWPEVYDYIRGESCGLPEHLRRMLTEMDAHSEEIWAQIEELPVVLCHRDFWLTNIFYQDGRIRVIDWDTAGWGYLGEDLASLLADEADVSHMVENYKRCVPTYLQGFSECAGTPLLSKNFIWEMILFIFGYRLVEGYKFAESDAERQLSLDMLQKIYEMEKMPDGTN